MPSTDKAADSAAAKAVAAAKAKADKVAAALRDSMPASSEDFARLVGKLNRKAAALHLEARSQNDLYFALFRRVDSRKRACIDFGEFFDMVRVLLQLSDKKISDEEIGSLWKYTDKRASSMSAGAFVKLMRNGWHEAVAEHAKRKRRLRLPDWDTACLRGAAAWDEEQPASSSKHADEREAEPDRQRPQSARGRPLNPAWNAACHRISKDGAAWDDRSMTFKERAVVREAEHRAALESFRDSRINSRGLG